MATGSGSGAPSKAVLLALGTAMFVYVVDTTIMAVSISDLVKDLDTDLSKIQMAMTVYTLTMAAFMVAGGKLGQVWGPLKAFRIGLLVYGVGTVTTALAPNFLILLLGWSILEGLGAALIVPAVNTLVRANFEGKKRASVYATIGAVSAGGAAVGPVVGGLLTTYLTWRVAFWVEAVLVVGVLIASKQIKEAERSEGRQPTFDFKGAALSVAGMGMLVFGVLQTSTLGWGSVVVWGLIAAGLITLVIFVKMVTAAEAADADPIFRMSILKRPVMWIGVPVMALQSFGQQGMMYTVPVFVQMVLGYNAIKTGLTILPMSIAVLIMAMATGKLGYKYPPRILIAGGLGSMALGTLILSFVIPGADSGVDFIVPMVLLGAGIGIVAAQISNFMLGGVEADETSEAAGLQATGQNLGQSFGTAIAGSVLVLVLAGSFTSGVNDSEVIPDNLAAELEQILNDNVEDVGRESDIEAALADQPPEISDELVAIAVDSYGTAFQVVAWLFTIGAAVGLLVALKLPGGVLQPAKKEDEEEAQPI